MRTCAKLTKVVIALLVLAGCSEDHSKPQSSTALSSSSETIKPGTVEIDGLQNEGQLKITSGASQAQIQNARIAAKSTNANSGSGNGTGGSNTGGDGSSTSTTTPPSTSNGNGNSSGGSGDHGAANGDNGSGNNGNPNEGSGGGGGKPSATQATFDKILISVTQISVCTIESDCRIISEAHQQLDLIQLSKNATVMLADHRLPPGTYGQIRLKLSGKATGIAGDQEIPITIPSGAQSGLKLNASFVIQKGFMTEINLTFDPEKSIHMTGNGKYMMKPVIKVNGMQEDLVAPSLAIVSPTLKITNQAQQPLQIEYEDSYLKLDSLDVKDNGADIKSKLSISESQALGRLTLTEGLHRFTASITDLAPNESATEHSILVDLVRCNEIPSAFLGIA